MIFNFLINYDYYVFSISLYFRTKLILYRSKIFLVIKLSIA